MLHNWGRLKGKTMGAVADEMQARLIAALAPTHIELIDDSEKHRGHAGHDGSGESHFTLIIESPQFAGKSRVAIQRAVYAALGDLMQARVHALAIRASAPAA
jgi:BolA protein